jgi:hypothetical protein
MLLTAGARAADSYQYVGKNSVTGQQSNNWNTATSWTNGPQPFPNAAGDVARAAVYPDGAVTLYLNQDVTLGTLDWSGSSLQVRAGNPAGKFIVANGGQPAVWPLTTAFWSWLDTDLVLQDSLTVSNSADNWDASGEAVRLNGVISGPGRLTLHWRALTNYPYCIGIPGSPAPNTYTGGTRLEGDGPGGGYFEPRKNGAFGPGDVELNGFAQLVLRDRGPMEDYLADNASLWLETSAITNRPRLYLDAGVNEVINRLYLDGVMQPAGTYGSSASAAGQVLDEYFAGNGILTVASGPANPGEIRNLPPSNVTPTNATLAGLLSGSAARPAAVSLFWGPTDGGRQAGAWSHQTLLGDLDSGGFSVTVGGWSPGQTIYYRCLLTNALGGKWADGTCHFGLPAVQNQLPHVRADHVTLRAVVTATNGLPTQAIAYCGPTDAGANAAAWPISVALGTVGEGLLTADISGLVPNTRYFYRFQLTNAAGAAWSTNATTFTMVAPPTNGEVVLLIASDTHYGAQQNPVQDCALLSRQVVDNMNTLPGQPWPASLSAGAVGLPQAALVLGDLTESGVASQWTDFTNDWGMNGERRLSYPVYEGYGNHDLYRGNLVRDSVRRRNLLRPGIVNVSSNGFHYSWDCDFLHIVCLNLFPGNELDVFGLDPAGSLQFLADDLATLVGNTRRPVVICHHYGFDSTGASWWSNQQRTNYFEAIRNYNVVAIFAGHSHTVSRVVWNGIDTFTDGTAGKWAGNYLAVRVTGTNLAVVERTLSNTWRFVFTKPLWLPGTLTVANDPGATLVTTDSARLNGAVFTPNSPPLSTAIYWGPNDGGTNDSGWANAARWEGQRSGAFFLDVAGLTPGATYFYRCAASNASGRVWAPDSARFRTASDFSAWEARMKITFPGYTGVTTLTNFPMLVVLNNHRAGFSYQQFASPAGNDLRFSDPDGVELNYEIDEWNTNGDSAVWVQVPRLGASNTAVWAYWKNPAAAAAPPHYTTNGATWSEGFVGVWHLNNAAALNSVNGTVGVPHGNATVGGLIGAAQSFSRAAGHQYIETGALNATNFTMEAWARCTNPDLPGGARVMDKSGAYTWAKMALSNYFQLTPLNNVTEYDYDLGDFPTPAWNYEVITYDAAASEARSYVNGVRARAQSRGLTLVPSQNGNALTISSPSAGYDGQLDEVRFSSVVRSEDWLKAGYGVVTNHEAFVRYDAAILNTPPVLLPVADCGVNAGETLRVTNFASDAESPPALLTFSLLVSPAGAVVDASSGVFVWQPGISFIGTTNLVVVKVGDNGNPPRSATQDFRVIVWGPRLPIVDRAVWSNGLWQMNVWGPNGAEYGFESSTNLSDWVTLHVTNPPAVPFWWSDTSQPRAPARFYRVRLRP